MKFIKLRNKNIPSNMVVVVDDDNYEDMNQYKWYLSKKGYAFKSWSKNNDHLMHRMIVHAIKGEEVDHINRNKLDNRKDNLRFCTRLQNTFNSPPRGITGYRGVCIIKGHLSKPYTARIRINGKTCNLGYFDTAQEASDAYEKAAIKYMGEFAYLDKQKSVPLNTTSTAFIRNKRGDNTSGYVGIYWSKKREKWIAQIGTDHKVKVLGSYFNIEAARLARRIGEIVYYER